MQKLENCAKISDAKISKSKLLTLAFDLIVFFFFFFFSYEMIIGNIICKMHLAT